LIDLELSKIYTQIECPVPEAVTLYGVVFTLKAVGSPTKLMTNIDIYFNQNDCPTAKWRFQPFCDVKNDSNKKKAKILLY